MSRIEASMTIYFFASNSIKVRFSYSCGLRKQKTTCGVIQNGLHKALTVRVKVKIKPRSSPCCLYKIPFKNEDEEQKSDKNISLILINLTLLKPGMFTGINGSSTIR